MALVLDIVILLMLEHHSSKVTSGAGFLACREPDDALGLAEVIEGPVPKYPAAHPDASRPPDKTRLWRVPECALTVRNCHWPSSLSPNQLDQKLASAYRTNPSSELQPIAHGATDVGDWQESSAESRVGGGCPLAGAITACSQRQQGN